MLTGFILLPGAVDQKQANGQKEELVQYANGFSPMAWGRPDAWLVRAIRAATEDSRPAELSAGNTRNGG